MGKGYCRSVTIHFDGLDTSPRSSEEASCECLAKLFICCEMRPAYPFRFEEASLADWKAGDFKQLKVFVRNEEGGPL
jgi:hypothetical protein